MFSLVPGVPGHTLVLSIFKPRVIYHRCQGRDKFSKCAFIVLKSFSAKFKLYYYIYL